jgi:hypothetical protein
MSTVPTETDSETRSQIDFHGTVCQGYAGRKGKVVPVLN